MDYSDDEEYNDDVVNNYGSGANDETTNAQRSNSWSKKKNQQPLVMNADSEIS